MGKKKANSMLGVIRIENTTACIVMPLYRSMVEPHFEYSIEFWSLYLKIQIAELEKVRRRVTKIFPVA